jgi:hypothetical protein
MWADNVSVIRTFDGQFDVVDESITRERELLYSTIESGNHPSFDVLAISEALSTLSAEDPFTA